RKRWVIMAALVGGMAATAVWCWPAGPRWQQPFADSCLLDWDAESRWLYAYRLPPRDQGRFPPPELLTLDTATGAPHSRTELPCDNLRGQVSIQFLAGERHVLVGEASDPQAARGEW